MAIVLEEVTSKEGRSIFEYGTENDGSLDRNTPGAIRGRVEVQKVHEHYMVIGKLLALDPRFSLHRFESENIGSQTEATDAARIVARRYAAKWAAYCEDTFFDTTREALLSHKSL